LYSRTSYGQLERPSSTYDSKDERFAKFLSILGASANSGGQGSSLQRRLIAARKAKLKARGRLESAPAKARAFGLRLSRLDTNPNQ
jgi:hypothetical protein